MTNRILLTGNNGYIGTVMTRLLKEASYTVIGLDCNWFENKQFFPPSEESKPDKQIVKDIRDIDLGDLDGIDAVVHLAGLSNDPLGDLNPRLTEDINYTSTVKLAELCKRSKIERFLFASSCSIYGISNGEEAIDENGTINPLTAYAKAKARAEIHLNNLADDNFHPVIMRNATVYGLSPRLRLDLVVNNLLAWAYITGEITIMSDGKPWRPIIHIEDFCNAFIAALKAPVHKVHKQAFNVGINKEIYQVKDIANEIQKILPQSKIKIMNKTGKDERTYKVDFSKIKNVLPEFKPEWDIKKGLTELLDAFKHYNFTAEDFKSNKYFRIRSIRALSESGRIDARFYKRKKL